MILLKGGTLVDPVSETEKKLDIILKEDKIWDIGIFEDLKDFKQIIDISGLTVAPGLIDVHVHFREPGFEYKEDILSGANAAKKGGFTTVICMANTSPVVDNTKTLKMVLNKGEETGINILSVAGASLGLKGKELTDMENLVKEGASGFSDDGMPIMDTALLREAMLKAKELDVPISLHEEDPAFITTAGVHDGEVARELGIRGATALAEYSMIARDAMIALETKAKVNIQHISSRYSVEQVRLAKKLGANIFAEVTPQHFSRTDDILKKAGSLGKINPPIRTDKDRLALIQGLKDGTIDIIATDHAPHSKEEKDRGLKKAPSGMIGLETALALGITHLVREGHLSLSQLIKKMTVNPAKLYGLTSGRLEKGSVGDIVVFDKNEKWRITDDFASKSKNSPFIGDEVYGKVKYTICSGKIVYKE